MNLGDITSVLSTGPMLLAGVPALGERSQDVLQTAGPQAALIRELWWWMVALCTGVFAAVLAAFVLALWRAPRATAQTAAAQPTQPAERRLHRSVAAAVVISALLLLGMVGASVATDRALAHLVLRDALHIELTAHQWWWEARYDHADVSQTFTTANELHIPVGRPVIFSLRADDVIHSLWIPNLAGKKDLIPGRTATLALRADKPGVYRAQCAEFCGLQHAWMAMLVTADIPQAYELWAAQQRQPAAEPVEPTTRRGREVFLSDQCVMCHNIAGTEATGQRAPDLTHVASRHELAAGALPNTADAMASWITDPQQHKPGANMPARALPPDDLHALVAYLRSLR